MGSSTASGAGASRLAWVDRLRLRYQPAGVSTFNLARGGTTTYAGLPASSPPVAGRPAPQTSTNVDAAVSHSPRLLIVSYPTNDVAAGWPAEEPVRNLLTIRQAALEAGAAVIVLSTQPATLPVGSLEVLRQIDVRLAAAIGSCFVPVREALAGPDGGLATVYDSGDGLHPNEAGHALIEARVAEVIDSGRCVRLSQ